MGEASYAVGNRVYRGGSSAPTRGTVDPQGYVERELNKPSDSRSGLAQAALQQLQQMQGSTGTSDTGGGAALPGTDMSSPVGVPPAAQRQITVTPSGKHVFLDTLLQQQQQMNPLQAAAMQLGMGQ